MEEKRSLNMKIRQTGKRLFMGLLTLLMLVAAVPFSAPIVAEAAKTAAPDLYFDELQCAQLPISNLNIARTNTKIDSDQLNTSLNGTTSGHRAYAIDLNNGNLSKHSQLRKKIGTKEFEEFYAVLAPCDIKVIAYGGEGNSVVVESLKPVRWADGTVDYITAIFTHDHNIKDIKKNNVYKQGKHFYTQGEYGAWQGIHLHLEVARGKVGSASKSFTYNLNQVRKNGVQASQVFFLDTGTTKGKDYVLINKNKIYMGWETARKVTLSAGVAGVADLVRYYPEGKTFDSLPTPVNPGKEFDGWYTAKTGGTKVTEASTVGKSTEKLYARWKNADGKLMKELLSLMEKKGTVKVTPTATDAQLTISTQQKYMAVSTGFYIGTNKDYLTKCPSGKLLTSQKAATFQLSESGFRLQPETTYYYQCYASAQGQEVRGEVKSFKTPKGTASAVHTPKALADWSNQKDSGVTENSAKLSIRVDYKSFVSDSGGTVKPKTTSAKPEKYGIKLGTAPNKLSVTGATQTPAAAAKQENLTFDLAKSGIKLKPGTTYYYQFYLILDGREQESGIRSFKTKGQATTTTQPTTPTTQPTTPTTQPTTPAALTVQWKDSTENVTQTDATVSARAIYNKSVKPEKYGLYGGLKSNQLVKVKTFNGTQAGDYTEFSVQLSKNGITLQAGTTYYYAFFVVVDGKEYKTETKSVTTPKAQTPPPTTPTQPVTPALNPKWSAYQLTKVTPIDATVSAKVTYGKTVKLTEGGFYLGTDKDSLVKVEKHDSVNEKRNYSILTYNMKKYGQTLKPGTTYYYCFYVIVDGAEYKSAVKSFTTEKKLNPVWSDFKISGVTQNDATVAAKVTYGKTVMLQTAGFYLGTDKDKLVKAEKYDTANANRNYSGMSYNMKKYGQALKSGTTYYYCFYVIVDGVEYRSPVKSFKTK